MNIKQIDKKRPADNERFHASGGVCPQTIFVPCCKIFSHKIRLTIIAGFVPKHINLEIFYNKITT